MEKNFKKNIYVCIAESLCCTSGTNTNIVNQLYFNKKNQKQQKNTKTKQRNSP